MGQNIVGIEMPRYRCHKEVWALEIGDVEYLPDRSGRGSMTPVNERYGKIELSADFMRRNNPQVGGYFVVYKDGYQSYSPKEAFEEGYTLITDNNPQTEAAG